MTVNLVMAEFGRNRVNIGGAQFGNQHRLKRCHHKFLRLL